MKYYIPRVNLEQLNKLVKSLQKKTEVKYQVFEDDIKIETFWDEVYVDGIFTGEYKKINYKTVGVELECDYKVGDYKLVAELEHTSAGNIISSIGTNPIEIPERYRDCKPYCEHCNTLRYRNKTFLLVDNHNNFKQVGKSCLNEYTGIDAEFIVNKLTSISSILSPKDGMDEELKEALRRDNCPWYEVDVYLNIMYQVILEYGYNPKDYVWIKKYDEFKYRKDLEDKVNEIKSVVNSKWNNGSDYCHNIEVIIKLGMDDGSHFRLLFSFVNSAVNYLATQVKVNNEYLGNVGDKVEFEVLFYKTIFTSDNPYDRGTTSCLYTYRIVTKTNQVVIWKTDKYLKDFDIKSIKGTIKALKTYKDENQTVVTRCTIEEVKKPFDETQTAEYGFKKFMEYVEQ